MHDSSSSLTRHDEGDDPSFGLVVVGLLGAAMLAMKVVTRRSSVAFRRDQYSTVDATTPIQVWSTGTQYQQTKQEQINNNKLTIIEFATAFCVPLF